MCILNTGKKCHSERSVMRSICRRLESLRCFTTLRFVQHDKVYILPISSINEANGANIIAFSVGIGDGFYSSYFGYGADNSIVKVVTTCI